MVNIRKQLATAIARAKAAESTLRQLRPNPRAENASSCSEPNGEAMLRKSRKNVERIARVLFEQGGTQRWQDCPYAHGYYREKVEDVLRAVATLRKAAKKGR